jgi:hypothetical protein
MGMANSVGDDRSTKLARETGSTQTLLFGAALPYEDGLAAQIEQTAPHEAAGAD